MNDKIKNILLWLVIALVLMSVFSNFVPHSNQPKYFPFSTFLEKLENHEIKEIKINSKTDLISASTHSNEPFMSNVPVNFDLSTLADWHKKYNIVIKGEPQEQQSMLMHIFVSWFPIILFIGVWVFYMRQMQGGGPGRGPMSFGRSKAKLLDEDTIQVTFDDVAGVSEAKEEVKELVFLVYSS